MGRSPGHGVSYVFQPHELSRGHRAGTAPIGVAIGDFNGDAKVDLAVVNSGDLATGNDGNVSILLGNGDGSFQPAVNFAAGKNPQSIVALNWCRFRSVPFCCTGASGNTTGTPLIAKRVTTQTGELPKFTCSASVGVPTEA